MRKYLRPFRKRLIREGVLHAVAWALTAGAAASFLYMLIRHLFFRTAALETCAAVGVGTGVLVCGIAYGLFYRPTWMYTAKRVDDMGLEARAETMLLLKDEQTTIAKLQRQDAIRQLSAILPEKMELRYPRKEWILAGVLAASVLITACCPYLNWSEHLKTKSATDESNAEQSVESARIAEMIESLREQVNHSNLSEEEKQRLLEQLAQMEASFDFGTAGLEELAQMSQLYQDMSLDLSSLEIYGSLTAELLNCPGLRALGEAVLARDQTAVRSFFTQLETEVAEDIADGNRQGRLKGLISDLRTVTKESKANESEKNLSYILATFETGLSGILSHAAAGEDVSESLHKTMYRTAEYICISFYGDVQEITQMFEENAKNGDGADSSSDGEMGEKGMDDAAGMSQSLYNQGTSGVGFGGGEDRKEKTTETERLYEPSLDVEIDESYVPGKDESPEVHPESNKGNVAYETVYGLYYAKMLREIDQETLPDDVLDVVETYFNGL